MIPNNIFLMWDSPRSEWPELVRFCTDLWIQYNPDFNVHVYDAQRARALIQEDFDIEIYDSLKVQHQSDILRTKLLSEIGGIWIDATCMPHRPVRLWIDEYKDCDFAGLRTLQRGQIVDNWFMISKKSSILMTKQYQALRKYWKTPKISLPQDPRSIAMIAERWRFFVSEFAAHDLRVAPYFLWHYLFHAQVENDPEFAECFKAQKFSSSDGGCGFVAMELMRNAGNVKPLPEKVRSHIIRGTAPLSKLIRHNPDVAALISDFRLCLEERRILEGF